MAGELRLSKADLNFESIVKYSRQGTRFEVIDYGDEHLNVIQGIACDRVWQFQRLDEERISYNVLGRFPGASDEDEDMAVLHKYFQLDTDLPALYEEWSHDATFKRYFEANREKLQGLRVFKQDPLHVFIRQFLTRTNAQVMADHYIETICELYGDSIQCTVNGEQQTFYNFPTLDQLNSQMVGMAKDLEYHSFGCKAPMFVKMLQEFNARGGITWLNKLRRKHFRKAIKKLIKLDNVGQYVAEHVCLFGFGMKDCVLTKINQIFNVIGRLYLPDFPRHQTSGSISDPFRKRIRHFFVKTFPNYSAWNSVFWISHELMLIEELSEGQTSTKRKCKRKIAI